MSGQASLDLWTKQVRLDGYKVVSERRDTPSDPVRLTLVAAGSTITAAANAADTPPSADWGYVKVPAPWPGSLAWS